MKLFIVAWLQATTPTAPNNALTTACDVSVLPATTAALDGGERKVPGRDDEPDRLQAAVV
jgi:hypothetical protein